MERPEISYHEASFDFNNFHSKKELEEIKQTWIAYINEKYPVGYSEENTCVQSTGKYKFCTDFNIDKDFAHMYGKKPEDVKKCKITIIEEGFYLAEKYRTGYDSNSTDYFGWISYNDNDDKKHRISLIQPNIKMFSMQFPGAGDYEQKQKSGKIVRLNVELIDET